MANSFRIKRRISGAPGAPSGLKNAELAYNEVDDILYYGKGISTGDTAAAVIALAGPGLYVGLTGDQSVAGIKTFTGGLVAPTMAGSDNSTNVSTTAWVRGFAQPLAATLTALAALSTSGFHAQTGPSAYASRTLTGTAGRLTITNGAGIAGDPTFDLATSGVTAGTYSKITVDAYGRATVGANIGSSDVTTALGFTPENAANKGVANGYASLDAGGKVPVAQLPASVTGGMNYQGTWNATTNSPTLVNGTGTKGFYYKVSVAGGTTIDGNANWTVGDLIAFNGTVWDKIEGGGSDVISVAGRVGAITLTTADIGGLGTIATQASNAVNITGGTIAASTISGNITGNAANVTGTVAVANGGTGATSLTGYVKGNGTAAMTASATIPNTDITGLGTMSTQAASAVNITGGTATGLTNLAVRNGGTGAFDMTIAHNGTLTAGRALTFNLNDVARTISLSGNLTVSAAATISGTNTGDQTITLTGDVTGSGTSSFATAISAASVTLAKMANLAANSIIGNNTGSAATPIALTAAQVKTMLAIANTDVSGLGTMSTQNASAVAITGGTIDGITLDGGTF